MYRKSFLLLALAAVAGSTAQAQVPVAPQPGVAGPYRVDVVTGMTATPLGNAPGIPQGAPPQAFGVAPFGQPVPGAVAAQGFAAPGAAPQGAAPLPPTVVTGPTGAITQGIPIPPGSGPITSAMPQPTVALTTTYGAAGPTQQTQIYTPTYYYYYYQPQQQQQQAQAQFTQPQFAAPQFAAPQFAASQFAQPQVPVAGYGYAPVAAPVMYGAVDYSQALPNALPPVYPQNVGSLMNARGEVGHVRYPYHSYRRPWYFPGQPSFNVTIDGPVW